MVADDQGRRPESRIALKLERFNRSIPVTAARLRFKSPGPSTGQAWIGRWARLLSQLVRLWDNRFTSVLSFQAKGSRSPQPADPSNTAEDCVITTTTQAPLLVDAGSVRTAAHDPQPSATVLRPEHLNRLKPPFIGREGQVIGPYKSPIESFPRSY